MKSFMQGMMYSSFFPLGMVKRRASPCYRSPLTTSMGALELGNIVIVGSLLIAFMKDQVCSVATHYKIRLL